MMITGIGMPISHSKMPLPMVAFLHPNPFEEINDAGRMFQLLLMQRKPPRRHEAIAAA